MYLLCIIFHTHSYLAEFLPTGGERKQEAQNNAKDMYEQAVTVGRENLESTNPILLGLTLNFSVFHFEICNAPEAAISLAKEGFDRVCMSRRLSFVVLQSHVDDGIANRWLLRNTGSGLLTRVVLDCVLLYIFVAGCGEPGQLARGVVQRRHSDYAVAPRQPNAVELQSS